jgi:hypothetical protein
MDFDPAEIRNPKLTAERRMRQAESGTPPAKSASAPATMSQSDFTSGGPITRAKNDSKKNAKFIELMRKHQQ